MTDTVLHLRRVAEELTRSSRRYDNGNTQSGAFVLASLLMEYADRDPALDPDIVQTFLGVADRLLERSTRLH
jgi:hypothetical protein